MAPSVPLLSHTRVLAPFLVGPAPFHQLQLPWELPHMQTEWLTCLGTATGFLVHLERHPNAYLVFCVGRAALDDLGPGRWVFILFLRHHSLFLLLSLSMCYSPFGMFSMLPGSFSSFSSQLTAPLHQRGLPSPLTPTLAHVTPFPLLTVRTARYSFIYVFTAPLHTHPHSHCKCARKAGAWPCFHCSVCRAQSVGKSVGSFCRAQKSVGKLMGMQVSQ